MLAWRGSCWPGFVHEARESVGVSWSGRGLLARGAPWLRGRASAAGSGGPLLGLPDLELPGRLLLAGIGWVGAASRQAVRPGRAVFILKRAARFGRGSCGCVPCCCSPQLLWALRNLQPQKCGWGPPPPSVLFWLARPPVTSAEKRTVARLQSLPRCRQYGRLSLGAREGN